MEISILRLAPALCMCMCMCRTRSKGALPLSYTYSWSFSKFILYHETGWPQICDPHRPPASWVARVIDVLPGLLVTCTSDQPSICEVFRNLLLMLNVCEDTHRKQRTFARAHLSSPGGMN